MHHLIMLQIVEGTAGQAVEALKGNLPVLLVGIALIIATILIIKFIKHIIVNSILGVVAWAIIVYGFNIKISFWFSLIASAIFGLAGIGVLLMLKFFGVVV